MIGNVEISNADRACACIYYIHSDFLIFNAVCAYLKFEGIFDIGNIFKSYALSGNAFVNADMTCAVESDLAVFIAVWIIAVCELNGIIETCVFQQLLDSLVGVFSAGSEVDIRRTAGGIDIFAFAAAIAGRLCCITIVISLTLNVSLHINYRQESENL